MGPIPEWVKWPVAIVSFAAATNGIAKFLGYERTTAEQKLEVFKAEQKGYHQAKDSAQQVRDSTQDARDSVLIAHLIELDEHQEDGLTGECTENTRTEMVQGRRFRLMRWCLKHDIPFKPESP